MRPCACVNCRLQRWTDEIIGYRIIRGLVRQGNGDMSKFLQLADDIESDLREFDDEADALNRKRLQNKDRAKTIFDDHHSAQDRVAEGLRRMEAVMHDMGGSNSRKMTDGERAALTAKVDQAQKDMDAAGVKTAATTALEGAPKLGEASDGTSESTFQAAT